MRPKNKEFNIKKYTILFLIFNLISLILVTCSKSPNDPETVTFSPINPDKGSSEWDLATPITGQAGTVTLEGEIDQLFNNMQNNNSNIKLLSKIFAKYEDIKAVYLFRSHVSGKTNPESDIDLGIVPASLKIKDKELELLADLAQHGFCNVDIVFLDTDDIVLKYEVIRNNKLIYQKSDFDHGSFFSKILRQYFDFLPYLEMQRQAYKGHIQNG